jgi:hypothetical protein
MMPLRSSRQVTDELSSFAGGLSMSSVHPGPGAGLSQLAGCRLGVIKLQACSSGFCFVRLWYSKALLTQLSSFVSAQKRKPFAEQKEKTSKRKTKDPVEATKEPQKRARKETKKNHSGEEEKASPKVGKNQFD